MSRSKRSPKKKAVEVCELRAGKLFVPAAAWPAGEVPECVLASPKLSPGAKLCYWLMTRMGRYSGQCYASVSTLATMLSRTERQVWRYLDELIERRYVRGKERPGLPTVWRFLWHKRFPSVASRGSDKSVTGGVTKTSVGVRQKRQMGYDRNVTHNRIRNRNGEPLTSDERAPAAPPPAAESPALARALHELVGRPDPQAAAQIAVGCRLEVADVTDAELATFARLWWPLLARQRGLLNPLGYLITRMPRWVAAALPEHREGIERERVAAERARQESRAMWQAMLEDPRSTSDDRALARRMLAGAGGG